MLLNTAVQVNKYNVLDNLILIWCHHLQNKMQFKWMFHMLLSYIVFNLFKHNTKYTCCLVMQSWSPYEKYRNDPLTLPVHDRLPRKMSEACIGPYICCNVFMFSVMFHLVLVHVWWIAASKRPSKGETKYKLVRKNMNTYYT